MKYKVIYSDPPWTYDDKCHSGERGVEYKYDTMTLSEIRRLNVSKYADDDCALFLWSTMPMIPEALKVMNAWGFRYKTVAFVWVKTPRGKEPSLKFSRNDILRWFHERKAVVVKILDYIKFHWGMGNWTRANSEVVLLGVRGKPKRVSKGVHSVVLAQHMGEHSRKPDEVRNRIVELMGDVPRLEMFARPPVAEGWNVWGKDVNDDVDIGPYRVDRVLLNEKFKKIRDK